MRRPRLFWFAVAAVRGPQFDAAEVRLYRPDSNEVRRRIRPEEN
jgi:hypothetical protein